MPKSAPPSKAVLVGFAQPVRIGFIPVVDCAPLLVARELDLFRKHGVHVELSGEVGWATIREKLLYGQVDAAHAIAGLALAMRLGLSAPPSRVVAPFVLNLQGNAITLSRDLWNRGVRDATGLRKLIRSSTRRVTFGMVSKFSSHHFLLRQWLASGGIDAEKDVRIVALPPTQVITNLTAGLIDGFCVGEPWNSAAVEQGLGWIAATSQQLAPGHPEKVLLMSEAFIEKRHNEATALVQAINEACAFCDLPKNRPDVVRILAKSGYFNACMSALKASLVGPFDFGTGEIADASSFYLFHRDNANSPTPERGRWLLNEFMTHGLLPAERRAEAAVALRQCWTASAFPSLPASAAAKTKPTTTNRITTSLV